VRRALPIAFAIVALAPSALADGALESTASRAAKALAAGPSAALVVSAPLASDVPAPKSEELAARVAQLVAGALGGAAHAHPKALSLAQARAAASRDASLVFVQPEIARGALRLTVDAYAVVSNGWDRARDPEPPPRAHAFADAPLDAEVRAFLAPILLEHASVHRAKHAEGDVLAVACGDLDGDGGLDLALVSRARVAVGHVAGGVFVPAKTAAWAQLASRAPVPLREPIGGASIVVDPEPRLFVGTTDRAGVALDAQLVPRGVLRGIPVADDQDACAVPNPRGDGFEGDAVACAGPAKEPRFLSPAPRYDAMAAADLVRPDGSVRAAAVAREAGAKLDARFGEATRAFDGVGAQVAVGDLDQDGAPEIVTSAADGDDALTIWSWDGTSDARERLRVPAPGGVRAVSVCPPEEGGAPALVAVVADEVWIVR
jgi:hypothetical protein